MSGFFTILAPSGQLLGGLELEQGTGFDRPAIDVRWEAWLAGVSIASGTVSSTAGTVIGFSSVSGFDRLDYTSTCGGCTPTTTPGYENGFYAPAFDDVRAQVVVAIPEPASLALLATGLVSVFGTARRRRKA